jgi:N6-adenosine-specific RNA methylase IME4
MSSVFDALPLHQARVILADPPWFFRTHSEKGWHKSTHAKYRCMALERIAALPVADLCAPDCLLVMWATAPHLPQALSVMQAWGLTFETAGCWAKQSRTGSCWVFGTGYLLRSAAEFCLIGTRGRITQLARSSRNLIAAPIREHSRKPDQMYELIEATWPMARPIRRAVRDASARGLAVLGTGLGNATVTHHMAGITVGYLDRLNQCPRDDCVHPGRLRPVLSRSPGW